jgi:acyl-CoA reductase-like NAD-dependent aldehyde dehydrogenase
VTGTTNRSNRRFRDLNSVTGRVVESNGRGRNDRPTTRDRIETALKSGPVKQWKDMSPEERARVLADLKGGGR